MWGNKNSTCSTILIYETRGLGVDVAKNTILNSPENVIIFALEILKIRELNSNFYLNERILIFKGGWSFFEKIIST